jgi:uncharacterized repeat protein (TIGR01451 family)
MKTSIQNSAAKGIAQSSDQTPPIRETGGAGCHSSGRLAMTALLLGLFLFLFSAASARAERNPTNCLGSGLGISLYTSLPDVHIGDTIYYSVNVFNTAFPSCNAGETNPATAGAIQAYIVTPNGVTNSLTLRRTFLAPGDSDFYTNIVSYVVRAQDILSDGTVRATATDEGDIHQNDTDSYGGGNQGVNTEVNLPCIQIAVQCVGSTGENGAITFSGTVTNCGNVTLVGVTVTNFVNNGIFTVLFPTNLTIGQVATFSGSWIPLNPCSPSTATLVAQGTDQYTSTPKTVTSTASTTCSEVLTPGIKVTKVCPAQPVAPGQLLTFSGSVSNTGNVTLTNIVVLNNQPVANTTVFTLASLAPGVVANFTGSYLAPTNCSVTDTLTGTGRSICGIAVTNTATATCPILTTPAMVVTATCPVTPVVPGGSLTYSGTVSNAGNNTLTNIIVVSDRPASNTVLFTRSTLAPGVSTNFTGTYTVPTNACSVTTTFTGTGKDICTLNAATNTVATTCSVTTTPAIGVTLACPAVTASAGGLITYTGVVTNSGNVILNNVTVVNNQASPSTVLIVPSLPAHASASFTASFTAPIDACTVSSTVIATGSDNCTSLTVTNTASATCSLITTPGLLLTKTCPVESVAPGQLFTFSGSVSNTGNVTLTNIAVLNNQPATNTLVFTLAALAPGAITNFTGSYLAPTNCSVTDTLTGTGRSICGTAVTNKVTATCPILTTPAIVVTLTCPTISVLPGGILTYSGTVSNAGNYTLTNIVVVNNRPAANTVVFTRTTLAPGATASFSGSYQVPIDCCVVWSTATASGQGCDGVTVTDTDTSTCTVSTLPNIVVTKICTSGILHPGDLLTYSGSVSNAGNVTLLNVTVASDQPTNRTSLLGPIALAPGESVSYTASYIVPPDFCGSDTVTASGWDMCSYLPVTNSVTATCPVTMTPRLTITQNCPAQPTPRGGLYTFTGSVSNAGNVTLVNVVVTNNYKFDCYTLTNRLVIGPITLAPGVSVNFSGSYTAPWSCCEVVDTLTARGQDRCSSSNVTATATAVCPLLTTPGIAVVQNCPPASIPMGSVYGYSGYVTNTGDAVLTNVLVFGPQGTNTIVLGPIELAPAESATYSGSYPVPYNTCSVIVTARGQDICAGNTVTNLASCPVATTALLALTQNCPVIPAIPGSQLTYSGSVSNAGNITLVNIVVTNNQSGNIPLITIATLTPGAVVSFNGSYLAPAACASTSTSTAIGQSLCGVGVTNTVSTTCPITTTPMLTLVLNCPEPAAVPGGLLTYSGTVSNAGNILITNIVVLNNLSGVTPVFTTNTLAPGAVARFTGSYVAPTNCSAVSLSTATGRSICGVAVTNAVSTTCPILTAPGITLVESCSSGPVTNGSLVTFLGAVTNIGNITLTNVFVFSGSSNGTPVLGPITLAPGASAPFAGSYTATGGSDPVTNSIIVTNGSGSITTNYTPVITTNTVTPAFGTINPVTLTYTNRFSVPGDLHGLMFANQDENWGPTLFYTTRQPGSGANTLDTISTISAPAYAGSPSVGYVTNEYSLTLTGYDALTLAAPDVGYGEINFYYLRHDSSNVCHFGAIKAAAASSDGDLPNTLAGTGFTGLAFAEDNVNSYGANMFYYVRNNAAGIAWFGSISPTPGLAVTDLYTVGTNFDALVYVTGTPISGWGTGYFAYLRHDSTGSILGTLNPLTHVTTDRLSLGTNFLSDLTFTATDMGYGANSFYYLRPTRTTYTTNIVTSYTTNAVATYTTNYWASFEPTNTVTASGMDLCQGRTVVAAADCTGLVVPLIIGAPAINSDGFFGLSIPTKEGQSYIVQYKNTLTDPAWTDLPGMPVAGTGGILIITDPNAAVQPTRFYRVSMP